MLYFSQERGKEKIHILGLKFFSDVTDWVEISFKISFKQNTVVKAENETEAFF